MNEGIALLYDLRIPKVHPVMAGALIECVYAVSGTQLAAGSKILDLSVDLGSAFAQDCPPISYYRIVLREKLWLRRLDAAAGANWEMDRRLAIFSTEADETLEATISREVRSAVAGIIYHASMWSGR